MNELAPYIAPALALYIIVRRGGRPRRIKPNRMWVYPLIISFLAATALAEGKPQSLLVYGIYVLALVAGAALGWFTAQHVELTLDEASGTIMSKPTQFGTILTAAVFVARFAVEYVAKGGPGGAPHGNLPVHRADSLIWFANAGLLFVVGRVLAQAAHMWIRVRPLVAQHQAAQK